MTIRELRVVAEVTFLLEVLSSRTKSLRVGENFHAQNLPSVGPIFTVLLITPSFLVRFLLVKYGIESLDILYALVKAWSVRSSFWSGQRSGDRKSVV